MSQLFLFNTEIPSQVSEDPEMNSVLQGLTAAFTAIQDNTSGFPVYGSNIQSDNLYRNTFPQRIQADVKVVPGDLLNIYFTDAPRARLASARDVNLFANSVALTANDADNYVMCAVKVAALPSPVLSTFSGSVYLSTMPGKFTDAPYLSGEILQKVGELVGDFFYFNFHCPALIDPLKFNTLARSL